MSVKTYDYNNVEHHNGIIRVDQVHQQQYNIYLTAIITLIYIIMNSVLVNHYSYKWFGNMFTGADIICKSLLFAGLTYMVIYSVSYV